jgi:hypothetical protein
MNSYGKKEHDPVFWLKLFLMTKHTRSVISWKDPLTDQTRTMQLRKNDWRIWTRFVMSFIINSICFHFLLHVLPIQIASKSSIMGVVFSSVGMIYLVDLDDTSGSTMTLVPDDGAQNESTTVSTGLYNAYNSSAGVGAGNVEMVKQRIIDEAMNDIRSKLELALASGELPTTPHQLHGHVKMGSITQALFLSAQSREKEHAQNKKRGSKEEHTPLMSAA